LNSVERVLKLFPAVLAAGLAVVYVLGAVVIGAEFGGAQIDPSDALPLLSIDQLLARGVGVLVKPTILYVAFQVVVLLMNSFSLNVIARINEAHDHDAKKHPSSAHKARSRQRIGKLAAWSMGVFVALILFFAAPTDQLLGATIVSGGLWISFAGPLAFPDTFRNRPKWWPLMIGIVTFLIGFGVIAYTDPSPRPELHLKVVAQSDPLEGLFVTHNDSTWYFFEEGTEDIRGIPDTKVVDASIQKRPDGELNDEPTLAEYAWSALPAGLP
jgi:hypothetical protein